MSLGGGMARAKAQGQEQRSGVRRVGLGRCTDPFKGSHGHVERALTPFVSTCCCQPSEVLNSIIG